MKYTNLRNQKNNTYRLMEYQIDSWISICLAVSIMINDYFKTLFQHEIMSEFIKFLMRKQSMLKRLVNHKESLRESGSVSSINLNLSKFTLDIDNNFMSKDD